MGPFATRCIRELSGRSDADRRLVYEALCDRVGFASDTRRETMRDALSACAGDTGVELPSAAQYERWRASKGSGAPTVSQMRTEFRGWSNAQRALLGEPEVDPTAHRPLRYNYFSPEGVSRALVRFLTDLATNEPASERRYEEWATTQGADGGAETVPLSAQTAVRRFGSWAEALAATGLEWRVPARRRSPQARGATRNTAIGALVAAREELGEIPSGARYDRWVRERDGKIAEEPEPRREPAPLAYTVRELCGGWCQALREAFGSDVPLPLHRPGLRYRRAKLIADWRACAEHLGHAPSACEYDAWRYAQIAHESGSEPPAHSNTLQTRLGNGSWSAIAVMLGWPLPRSRRSRRQWTREELESWWHVCVSDLGHAPTTSGYDRWRELRIEVDGTRHLPNAPTLARRLGDGTWGGVAAALGVAQADGRAPFAREELVEAYHACADALGHPPSLSDYIGWRSARLRRDSRIRLPTHRTLERRLGDGKWSGVAAALEIANTYGRPPFTREELAEAWHACADALGHSPSLSDYIGWRSRWRERDPRLRLPHHRTMMNGLGYGRWGAIAAALGAARGPVSGWSVQELTDAWHACAHALGHPPRRSEYVRWRSARLARHPGVRVPHDASLMNRLACRRWGDVAGAVARLDRERDVAV
jgi:hypothetical protein